MIIELEDGSVLVGKSTAVEVVDVEKAMVALVSTDGVDTDGDIIHQGKNSRGAGWVLDTFNKNPIVNWGHEMWRPNIGSPDVRAKVGKRDGGGRGLYLDPFAFDMGDPFAAEIAGKYQRRVLRQTSVGFIGLTWDRRMEGDMMVGREYFEQKLIEVSAVNVGANQETDTLVKSMLGRHGLAAKVQAAGDAEALELRELVKQLLEDQEYMRREMNILSNAVKSLGDENSSGHAESVLLARAADKTTGTEIDLVATALLLRLKSLGVAQ